MTISDRPRVTSGDGEARHVPIGGGTELWVDQRGEGPDVVLVAGLTDPAEAWELQLEGLADRYRVTAFDNRGAGRSPLPPEGFSVEDLADDVDALMEALGIESAHVAGFSGGGTTAQHLALRHPARVRSLVLVSTWARADRYLHSLLDYWTWMAEVAPDERAMLEAFFLWVYTARAHDDGTVAAFVEDALEFPHPQSVEAFHRQIEAWRRHETLDRLGEIAVPTLVVAGSEDICVPPRHARQLVAGIPGAELVVLEGEAHQPFQEQPEDFDALVDRFWSSIDRA